MKSICGTSLLRNIKGNAVDTSRGAEETAGAFQQEEIADYAKEAVEAFWQAGIIVSKEAGLFRPQGIPTMLR